MCYENYIYKNIIKNKKIYFYSISKLVSRIIVKLKLLNIRKISSIIFFFSNSFKLYF